jgi:hypothetical protein
MRETKNRYNILVRKLQARDYQKNLGIDMTKLLQITPQKTGVKIWATGSVEHSMAGYCEE